MRRPPQTDHDTPRETAAVVLNRPLSGALTYGVPAFLRTELSVGSLVEVPLGTRRAIGCVVAFDVPQPEDATFRVRDIFRVVSPDYVIEEELIELARWVAEYYFCSHGEALSTASMIGFSEVVLRGRSVYTLNPAWQEIELPRRQAEVAARLAEAGVPPDASLAELAQLCGSTGPTMRKLQTAGVLLEEKNYLGTVEPLPPPDVPPELMDDQRVAFEQVEAARAAGEFAVFLLHGVTGSGKTEVYLRLIERAFAAGQSALCLVPEIALTPQTVERFSRRFQEEIGVFHSQLSKVEKLVLHRKIRAGQIRLVIGARSCVFSPLPNLGLIVIDEEHESSYKQGETPRYHARDLAIVRASRLRIPIVLGSATPSLDSYENAVRGKYRLLRLISRPAGLNMPTVRIVTMGRAATDSPDGLSLLSPDLKKEIDLRLERKQQVLLFLNRRGFSNFLMCPNCRWVARCDEDDIVLTIHRARKGKDTEEELDLFPRPLKAQDAFVKCHFCGRRHEYPTACPKCGEEQLVAMGSGTQRIEEALQRVFPGVNILRLDQDSVGGRRGFLRAWQEMVSGQAQIILGTQMIAKGLHLERVTLVGVILAEIGLFLPDFRAEERTFSLLTQVAGRSGRTDLGEVIFQTYMPQHPVVQFAAQHDYEGYFAAEMLRRRKARFPPVERLIALTLSDAMLPRAQEAARMIAGILRRIGHQEAFRDCRTLGPLPAPIERLAGRFRQRVLIRGVNPLDNGALLRRALSDPQWNPPSSVNLTIDVDPQDCL